MTTHPPPPTVFVTFWGTRGSISTPGRATEKYGGNTSCVTVRHEDTLVIVDAGTGIRNLGLDLADQPDHSNLHLLLSHTHWDHIQGLPFFGPSYVKGNRLTIHGSPRRERYLEGVLHGQMGVEYFPVSMNDLAAELSIIEMPAKQIEIGSVGIDWQEQVQHPGGSVRYRLTAGGKRVVYASDVELDQSFGDHATGPDAERLRAEYGAFIEGADLLIADGQYTKQEYATKVGWGHSSVPLVLDVARDHGVKQLAVFHHDPLHSDADLDLLWTTLAPGYREPPAPMNVFWAREGMTVAV